MNRRSGPWFARILCALALVVGLLVPQTVHATSPPLEPTATTAPSATVVPSDEIVVDEANPFLPDDRNLSDCVGMLQRPGCGSESRGGWHQNAVAIVMIVGLLLVFSRVAWGVRRSQQRTAPSAPD